MGRVVFPEYMHYRIPAHGTEGAHPARDAASCKSFGYDESLVGDDILPLLLGS